VKAGSGVATFGIPGYGIPGSAGVPEEIAQLTIALPYNDLAAVEQTFAAHPGDIACVILEPVAGNMGCVPPARGYLEGLRELTARAGAILIFDEVMTGFRVAHGGAQQLYGIVPDMTCLGKIIGGGLPVGAFGGRREIMDLLAPLGPVYQAGTLSGNPLAMAAGIATLEYLKRNEQEVYGQIESASKTLAEGVAQAARQHGLPVTMNRVGAMFTWFFQEGLIEDFTAAAASDTALFAAFHRGMLDRGVWLPPSQFEAAFIGTAHTPEIIEATLRAADDIFRLLAATQGGRSQTQRTSVQSV
jgi:glutamate-1-semialdehyde 2,1-aminomutase